MKKTLLIALIAAIFSTGTVLGQETQKITLEGAVKIALENNFQIKQAENDLEAANYNIKSEYADFLPSVTSSLSANRNTGLGFVAERLSDGLDPFVNVTRKSVNGRVSASLPIFNGFENILSLRQRQQEQLSSEETLQRNREVVIFSTASSFLQVILTKELIEIDKNNLESAQKQLEQVIAQVEVGSLPLVNQYDLESQVAQYELAITQQENTLTLNKLSLIRQMQIDPLGNYEFVIPEVDEERVSSDLATYDLRSLIDEALASRSDIRSQEARIKSSEYSLLGTRAALLPTLSASGSISSSYSDQYSKPGGGDAGFGDQFFDLQVNKGIGLSFNLPIFNNLNRLANIQNSQVNLKNQQLALEDLKLGVVQDVATAHTNYISRVKELDATEKALIFSERNFMTQQERFNVGASTLIEVTEARTRYVEAQSRYKQAIYNLIFQEKLLDYYLGKLSADNLEY